MEVRENGPWTVDEWSGGRLVLQSDDLHHDAALEISGDFGSPEEKLTYANEIARRLNAMNPPKPDPELDSWCPSA
jgi:hypothetical protein